LKPAEGGGVSSKNGPADRAFPRAPRSAFNQRTWDRGGPLIFPIAAAAALLGTLQGPALPGSWSDRVPRVPGARQFFASPDGKAENPGSPEAPWDLASALGGGSKIRPGDVLWVRGGTYRGTFEIRLAGREGAPIHVRTWPGERASILDSRTSVVEPARHLWLWDLEIAHTVPVERRRTEKTGSHPDDLPGGDGLNIYAGTGCKFINLVVHDNIGNGVGWWVGSTDSEMHGCLIYHNGWKAPDRGHGHCIYTQNRDGTKTISGCILSVPPWGGSYTMHAYGSSRAFINNYLIEDNVAHERGPFLVGGGSPSRGIRVLRNYLHGVDLRLGYGAENEDCEVRDNVVAGGRITIEKFRKVVDEGNVRGLPDRKTVLIPNRYDPRRAHLVVFNGAKAPAAAADVSSFLRPGEAFRLMDPRDLFGKPLLEGKAPGGAIDIPMKGEFAVFVLLRGNRP